MKIALIILSGIALVALIYILFAARYDTFSNKTFARQLAKEAMSKIGLDEQGWKTALVASETVVNATPEVVWQYWSQIERWPEWSTELHQSAKFTSDTQWEEGSTFEQALDLGMAGKVTGNETVKFVEPASKIMWWKEENGMKSCHIWVFERLDADKTKIINVEVFDGTIIGIMKPILIPDWQKKFDAGLINLEKKFQ
ncbi:MAG: SRPBCC family protein [Bacteroidota bacterium]